MDSLFAMTQSRERTELVVISTTLPGYCDSKADSALSNGYALSCNPGFVAQGSIIRDLQLPDQVLIGQADESAGEILERLHCRICLNDPAFHRMSRLSAEISKLATNCFLTSKIAFANAIGDLAVHVGAEPESINARGWVEALRQSGKKTECDERTSSTAAAITGFFCSVMR